MPHAQLTSPELPFTLLADKMSSRRGRHLMVSARNPRQRSTRPEPIAGRNRPAPVGGTKATARRSQTGDHRRSATATWIPYPPYKPRYTNTRGADLSGAAGLRLAPSGARQNGCYASMLTASAMT